MDKIVQALLNALVNILSSNPKLLEDLLTKGAQLFILKLEQWIAEAQKPPAQVPAPKPATPTPTPIHA